MNEIELNRLKIVLNNKTLQKKGDQMFLNLTEIGAIKKKALLKSQKALVKASNENYVDTNAINVINRDVIIKQDNLLDYLEYYEDFKTSCNTKEEGTK